MTVFSGFNKLKQEAENNNSWTLKRMGMANQSVSKAFTKRAATDR